MVANLIKIAKSFEHRMIPPTVKFSSFNPAINFKDLNIEVQTEPLKIPLQETPIIIGTSSFGMGGSNVHIAVSTYLLFYNSLHSAFKQLLYYFLTTKTSSGCWHASTNGSVFSIPYFCTSTESTGVNSNSIKRISKIKRKRKKFPFPIIVYPQSSSHTLQL